MRRWILYVAVCVGLCVALTGCGDAVPESVTGPSTPPATTASPQVVPWAALPATHPTLPTRTVPPRPDPAAAEAAPPCHADQVDPTTAQRDGAGGTLYFQYTIRLVHGPACRLEGAPDIQPLFHGQPVAVPVQPETSGDEAYRHPVLVGGPLPVHLWLGWSENWCAPALQVDQLRILLPGGRLDLDGPGQTPFCNGGHGPTPIMVWPYYPEGWRTSRTVSPYDRIEVGGDLNLSGTPGEPIDFTVTLTSPRDLVLDPCPDYTIAMYGDGLAETASYALDCAAVPMLPAHQPVTFAMRLTAPATDVSKLIWSLNTPQPPALGGQVVVSGGR